MFSSYVQVYDLSLLRDSDGFQVVEATAVYENFGNAHNIVANDDTDFVYAVGATANFPGFTCGGESSSGSGGGAPCLTPPVKTVRKKMEAERSGSYFTFLHTP